MKSHSQVEIFSEFEIKALKRAASIVSILPDVDNRGGLIRCHEVARICASILGMVVQDGYYGFVDHSWLWTRALDKKRIVGRIGMPNILDPYCVGSLPQVRLLDGEHTSLPHIGWSYRPGPDRDDIDHQFVQQWVDRLTLHEPHESKK